MTAVLNQMQMIHNNIYTVKVVKIEPNGFHVRGDDWPVDSKAAFVRRVQYDAVQSNLQVGKYVYAKLVKISVTYGMSVASGVVSQENGANMDANHHASRPLPRVFNVKASLQRQVQQLSQRHSAIVVTLDKQQKIAAKETSELKQQLRTVQKDNAKLNQQKLQLVSSAKQMAKEISLTLRAKEDDIVGLGQDKERLELEVAELKRQNKELRGVVASVAPVVFDTPVVLPTKETAPEIKMSLIKTIDPSGKFLVERSILSFIGPSGKECRSVVEVERALGLSPPHGEAMDEPEMFVKEGNGVEEEEEEEPGEEETTSNASSSSGGGSGSSDKNPVVAPVAPFCINSCINTGTARMVESHKRKRSPIDGTPRHGKGGKRAKSAFGLPEVGHFVTLLLQDGSKRAYEVVGKDRDGDLKLRDLEDNEVQTYLATTFEQENLGSKWWQREPMNLQSDKFNIDQEDFAGVTL